MAGSLQTTTVGGGPDDPVQSYGKYVSSSKFTHDLGVVVLPVASRTAAHRRIRLHGGMALRTVRWEAVRDGRPPIAPTPADTGAPGNRGDYLLSSQVVTNLPTLNQQGGFYTFEMSGEYQYVQVTPRVLGTNTLPTSSFPYPVQPMDDIANGLGKAAFSNLGVTSTLDDVGTAAEAALIPANGPPPRWPFTFVSPYFAAETITG